MTNLKGYNSNRDYKADLIKALFPEEKKVIVDDEFDFHLKRIKEIQTEATKLSGNITCKVLLRQLNCEYNRGKVTLNVNELFQWFETGQHLKEWKEWDTI